MKKWLVLAHLTKSQEIIPQILTNKGIVGEIDIENYLNPPKVSDAVKLLPQDFFESLKAAASVIKKHMESGNPVVIHGDYDADGICATAILYKTLKKELGYNNVHHFIPNRFDQGYGLSSKSIHSILETLTKTQKSNFTALFITVDCGITAISEVAIIKELGHDIIITDHHQKSETLPTAEVIVWYDQIVGSTISWLLSRVLGSKDTQTISLAAIATVTDLQPVLGFNRAILKKGLEVLNNNCPLGIKALLQKSAKPINKVNTYDIGWIIGPRLNASGRLVNADDSLNLLLAQTEKEALDFAEKLNQTNIQRQTKTDEMLDLTLSYDLTDLPRFIISQSDKYHEGIIGLVAAKLAQTYYRPAIVLSVHENFSKGSVRSIPNINIIAILRKFEHLFESLGGHPMAAGFTISNQKIAELEKSLLDYFLNQVPDNFYDQTLTIDAELPANLIDLKLIQDLEKLEPFGIGNEEPIFCTMQMGISQVNAVGKDQKHLSLKLFKDDRIFKAIFFNKGHLVSEINFGDLIDAAYNLKQNNFNGNFSIDLQIVDIVKKL